MAKGAIAIPRVFHRIWLGGPMPEEFVRFGETFERRHPDWEMRLWTEKNLPRIHNRAEFDRSTSYIQKAQILRYELLYQEGGVYIDTDFESLKSLDELLSSTRAFAASEDQRWISIGIMGAVPKHPLFDAVVRELPRFVSGQPRARISAQTGPVLFTRTVVARREQGLDRDFVVFHPKLFYPREAAEISQRYDKFPDAYAVHHRAESRFEPTAPVVTVTAPGTWGSRAKPVDPFDTPVDPFRILLGFDIDAPNRVLDLLVAYRELFSPDDPIELAVYAYAEPDLELLSRMRQTFLSLVGEPNQMAPISLYSRTEINQLSYAVCFFPTGNETVDAVQLSNAMHTLYLLRATLDHARLLSANCPKRL
jgi:hypothetical protein